MEWKVRWLCGCWNQIVLATHCVHYVHSLSIDHARNAHRMQTAHRMLLSSLTSQSHTLHSRMLIVRTLHSSCSRAALCVSPTISTRAPLACLFFPHSPRAHARASLLSHDALLFSSHGLLFSRTTLFSSLARASLLSHDALLCSRRFSSRCRMRI